MSIRVFSWDANPAIDPFSFRLSNCRAEELLAKGDAVQIDKHSIQKLPPREYRLDRRNYTEHGSFADAWGIKPSGGVPVWQMRT